MTGTLCCVPGCNSNTHANRNLTWHAFPKEKLLKKVWVQRINRQGLRGKYSLWSPKPHDRICGHHFNLSGRKKYEDKLPRFFHNKTYEKLNRVEALKTKNERIAVPGSEPEYHGNLEVCANMPELGAEVILGLTRSPVIPVSEESCCLSSEINYDHSYAMFECSRVTLNKKQASIEEGQEEIEILKEAALKLESKIKDLETELSRKNKQVLKLSMASAQGKLSSNNKFCVEEISKDKEALHFYTGFPSERMFNIAFKFLSEGLSLLKQDASPRTHSQGRPYCLSLKNQMFMVLCRLRVGLLEYDLAQRFKVSESQVSHICSRWIDFLAQRLVQVPIWPSKEIIQKYMPEEFQKKYPSTRVILDCTEFFIENPSDYTIQSCTYSTYKSHNTAKGLVGITPNGFISFVSDLVPGRLSDKEVTLQSGILQLLEPGDSIMADRGFIVEEELALLGVTVNVPPFLNGKSQLSKQEEEVTRDIASVRIHVERVIRDLKSFRLLKGVFPNSMHDKLNSVWKICCYLCNLMNEPLLNRTKQNN